MKGNYLRIYDTVQFSFLDQDWTRVKDDFNDFSGTLPSYSHGASPSSSTSGLLVSIAATHAGIVTRNNGFYLPDRMKKGASSFIQDFGKPILLHHDDHQDNVGRVVKSDYVDTSGVIIDKYDGLRINNSSGKQIATFNKSMIQDFISGQLPFSSQVDVIRNVFRDTILDEKDYDGLGYINITANISDPAAIQKLMDGRYLTGSVGASTDKAVCSVCRSDWTKGGPCDHKPGGIYDEAKCFIIAGDLVYDEYSFVNMPADRYSKVLQLHYNGIQDNIEVAHDFGRIYEAQLSFPQYDSGNKEESMKKTDTDNKDGNLKIEDSVTTDPAPKTDNTDGVKDVEVEDSTDTKPEDGKVEDDKQNESTTDQESVEDFVIRVIDSEDTPSDEDKLRAYQVLWEESDKSEDIKLTDEKLKVLPKSQFCDSKSLFPVHDEAHLVAAQRLFTRIKLNDESKESILATITRKARARGFSLSDDVATVQDSQAARVMRQILRIFEEDIEWSDQEPILDEQEMGMLRNILKRLSSLIGKDSLVKGLTIENLASNEKTLLDEIAKHEEDIGDLRDRLAASQKEYHLLFEDMQNLQDHLVEQKSNTRKIKEAHLQTLLTLKDSVVEDRSFEELSDNDLESKLKDMSESIDMTKITDKLSDGMSRTPVGDIKDPSGVQDNTNNKLSVENLKIIEQNYIQLKLSKGHNAAEAYLTEMKRQGFLPQDSEN